MICIELTGKDLIEDGWIPGPCFTELLDMAKKYQDDAYRENGCFLTKRGILRKLRKNYTPPPPKLKMREKANTFFEAIKVETKDEKANLGLVRKQMDDLLKTPYTITGAIMPDACPASTQKAVIPVGGAVVTQGTIIPSAHSADVCCSMYASFYLERSSVKNELDALQGCTRFGPGGRHHDDLVYDEVLDEDVWDNPFLKELKGYAEIHISDQGDGNHFAYIGEIEVTEELIDHLKDSGHREISNILEPEYEWDQNYGHEKLILRVLVTHHGSRGFGAKVFKRGQRAAEKYTATVANHVPRAAAWLNYDTDEGKQYWDALQYVSRWTKANHKAIHRRFLERIGASPIIQFGNEHNFVWKRGSDLFYHGKGATPAWNDQDGRPLLGLIPLNMAEPILITLGKNNVNYISFAPHGAGRNISRTELKNRYPTEEDRRIAIEESTKDIDVRWYCGDPDLGETPDAYKNADQVTEQIEDFGLATIIGKIQPLGCIMAGESKYEFKRK